MSSEPPSGTTHENEEGLAGESEDPSGSQRQRTVAAIVAALVVAAGVAAFLFVSEPETPVQQQPTTAAPTEGLACPHLLRAAEAYEQSDRAAYDREIDRAAEAAENALQTSGQAFGQPEEIALELDLGLAKDVERLLASGQEACLELERPSSG
jgi:uncharacterized protein HemX